MGIGIGAVGVGVRLGVGVSEGVVGVGLAVRVGVLGADWMRGEEGRDDSMVGEERGDVPRVKEGERRLRGGGGEVV